jgi:hypothetical protein
LFIYYYCVLFLLYCINDKSKRGGVACFQNGNNENMMCNNSYFENCTGTEAGGCFYLNQMILQIFNTTFIGNTAQDNKGNDIYIASSVTYPSSYLLGSCSQSAAPKILINTIDASDLLPSCITYVYKYVASSSSGGSDSNSCTTSSPCLTLSLVLSGTDNVNVGVLECDYTPSPVTIGSDLFTIITSTVENSIATIAFNSSYTGTNALFSLSSGVLEVENLTVIHNSDVKDQYSI